MIQQLLAERKQIDHKLALAVKAELQKISNATGLIIDMGMGSITFEQGSTVIYYDEVFNQNTLNKNPHHPKSLPDFLSHRGFKNPYQTQTEAQAEGNEKLWVAYGVKSQVAYHFYNLVITLAQNFPESNFPALWTICGPCQITPQKS